MPAAAAARKTGPSKTNLALADHLEHVGRRVEWLAGPAERKSTVALRLPNALPEELLSAVGRRLGGAKLYIGNDSGITHLAAATGCKVLAIFGATDPRVWAPRGKRVRVLGDVGRWPSVAEGIATCEMLSLE